MHLPPSPPRSSHFPHFARAQTHRSLLQLVTQFHASLHYISHHSPSVRHPDAVPAANSPTDRPASPTFRPDSPTTFAAAQRELARDLLVKEAQIEVLIASLPGIEKGEEDQAKELEGLEVQLREAEEERQEALSERQLWLEKLEEVIRVVDERR